MTRVERRNDEYQMLIDDLIADEAFRAEARHVTGRSRPIYDDAAPAGFDAEIEQLMVTDRGLWECIAEGFSDRIYSMN